MRILEVEKVCKSFEISQLNVKNFNFWLHQLFLNFFQNKKSILPVLKGVSFNMDSGEFVGVLGKNGSGKSTLLKIFAQITPPTSGEIRIFGRVASLIEVGTGFNKELTGRENILLNGAILGMDHKMILAKMDTIVSFAGINPNLLDIPIKKYSSGMKIRLAFAVAIHLNADLLLMDEILSVSDISFQKKGMQGLKKLVRQGKSVLFVSHDMNLIRQACTRAIVLHEGIVGFDGPVEEAIQYYQKSIQGDFHLSDTSKNKTTVFKNDCIMIKHFVIQSQQNGPQIFRNDTLQIKFEYELLDLQIAVQDKLKVRLIFYNQEKNLRLFSIQTAIPVAEEQRRKQVVCTIPNQNLAPGQYSVHMENKIRHNWQKTAAINKFQILAPHESLQYSQNLIHIDAIWDF